MESKHTPGPWECIDAKDHDGDATISIRGNGEFIATMELVSIRKSALERTAFILPENAEANARLIAAAPDLLAALEGALDALDGCDRFKPGLVDINVIVDVREAIAKAKGD